MHMQTYKYTVSIRKQQTLLCISIVLYLHLVNPLDLPLVISTFVTDGTIISYHPWNGSRCWGRTGPRVRVLSQVLTRNFLDQPLLLKPASSSSLLQPRLMIVLWLLSCMPIAGDISMVIRVSQRSHYCWHHRITAFFVLPTCCHSLLLLVIRLFQLLIMFWFCCWIYYIFLI